MICKGEEGNDRIKRQKEECEEEKESERGRGSSSDLRKDNWNNR